MNIMGVSGLHLALKKLGLAIREVDLLLEEWRAEHDPLAVHIFVSRRDYRNRDDHSKSGHHKRALADSTYREALKLGYRGSSDSWDHLLYATPEE